MITIDQLFERPNTNNITHTELVAILSPYFPLTRPANLPDAATTVISQTKMAPELEARLEVLLAEQKPGLLDALRASRK